MFFGYIFRNLRPNVCFTAANRMKTLYIARHAKSDWSTGAGSDFDRPLNERGRRDAPKMGTFLRENGAIPELILTSPAVRALTTARFLADVPGAAQIPLAVVNSLYMTDAPDTLEIIGKVKNSVQSLMIVGHNPTQTILTNYLTDAMIDNVPTCGVVVIEFPLAASWEEISGSAGNMKHFFYPKQG